MLCLTRLTPNKYFGIFFIMPPKNSSLEISAATRPMAEVATSSSSSAMGPGTGSLGSLKHPTRFADIFEGRDAYEARLRGIAESKFSKIADLNDRGAAFREFEILVKEKLEDLDDRLKDWIQYSSGFACLCDVIATRYPLQNHAFLGLGASAEAVSRILQKRTPFVYAVPLSGINLSHLKEAELEKDTATVVKVMRLLRLSLGAELDNATRTLVVMDVASTGNSLLFTRLLLGRLKMGKNVILLPLNDLKKEIPNIVIPNYPLDAMDAFNTIVSQDTKKNRSIDRYEIDKLFSANPKFNRLKAAVTEEFAESVNAEMQSGKYEP